MVYFGVQKTMTLNQSGDYNPPLRSVLADGKDYFTYHWNIPCNKGSGLATGFLKMDLIITSDLFS